MSQNIIGDILRREGGAKYTCDPDDRGGATKYGITQATLSEYRGHQCMPADVAALGEDEARMIYEKLYINRPHFDLITNDRLRALLVDWGVNSGPTKPIKALQKALGFSPSSVDGVLGPNTAAAANAGNTELLHNSVLAQRVDFYKALAAKDPSQEKFLHGWLNRCQEFA